MCGIAGILYRDERPVDQALLDKLADAMLHRGPDGRGFFTRPGIGLLQTRLAIIDLATGDQPFVTPQDNALIANGEIYNYIELKQDYPNYPYQTKSDCEVPLALYKELGATFPKKLRGMYSTALWDATAKKLLLSRDPFGIKPLYYVETPDYFAFASEAKTLIAAGLAGRDLDERMGAEVLQFQYSSGRDTAFKDIKRVLPGETLIIEGGRIIARDRIFPIDGGSDAPDSIEEALEQFDTQFQRSVELHQRSDVPYGAFLSGGVDSSSILSMMGRLNPNPVLAFTIGFPGSQVADERTQAEAVAKAVGAKHVSISFSKDDFWSLLPTVVDATDDPTADYAVLPTYVLAREASKHVKVVLTGEGGDEVLAGYGRHRAATRTLFHKPVRRSLYDKWGTLRRPYRGKHLLEAPTSSPDLALSTRLRQAQLEDIADWLPNDLLNKVDRCLMAHSMEGRVPFLDPVFGNFAFSVKDEFKLQGKTGKWLLKKWLEKQVPVAEPFAKKRGFTVPVGEWIGEKAARLGPLVARQEGIRQLCAPGAVEALFHNARSKDQHVWRLLYYALWHQRHILQGPKDGDVFDLLNA